MSSTTISIPPSILSTQDKRLTDVVVVKHIPTIIPTQHTLPTRPVDVVVATVNNIPAAIAEIGAIDVDKRPIRCGRAADADGVSATAVSFLLYKEWVTA